MAVSEGEDLECMHGGCLEEFESHQNRLAHSMEEHWNINPKKYPNMTGRGEFTWQE